MMMRITTSSVLSALYANVLLFALPARVTVLAFLPSSSYYTTDSGGRRVVGGGGIRLWMAEAPEALGSEGDWTAYLDEDTTGLVYYFNGRTGESLWEPPTKSFPIIVLPRPLRRKAETKRSEYIRTLRDREGRQNFPQANTARTEEEAKQQQQQQQQQQLEQQQQQKQQQKQQQEKNNQQEKWFDFLFEEEPEPEPNWFDAVSSVLKKSGSKESDTTDMTKKPKAAAADASSATPTDTVIEELEPPMAETEEPALAEEPKPVIEEQLPEKKFGLFERFGMQPTNGEAPTPSTTTTTETPPPPVEPVVEEPPKPAPKQPGFFERIRPLGGVGGGGGGGGGEGEGMATPETTVEEIKTVEKKKTVRRSLTFNLNFGQQPASVAEPETDVEETKTVEKKKPVRRSITFPLNFGLLQTPVVEPEPIVVTEPVITPIKIEAASCVLPHPAKMFWGGEDAVFTSGRVFGVFDGVTGASKLDGVPLYSKTLASEMRKASRGTDASGMSLMDLQRSLVSAKEVADASSTGASTAILASITQDGFLRALNIGDSACIVIRNNKVVARTREISHYFDCPYQFSVDSPDTPRDGTKLNIELVRGDVIVMGSDGVFDNLGVSDIIDIVVDSQQKNAKLSSLAKKISDKSRKVSLNRTAPTPYAKLAKRNGDPDFAEGVGGKVDDVSVIVVRYA